MTLASDRLQAIADVTEPAASRLAVGDAATALVNGDVPAEVPATVVGMAPTPDSTGDYPVTFALSQTPRSARAGLTASIDLTLAEAEDVLEVPTGAVHGSGADAFVQVVGADGCERVVPVRTGLVGDASTEILSGVRAEERVVVG